MCSGSSRRKFLLLMACRYGAHIKRINNDWMDLFALKNKLLRTVW